MATSAEILVEITYIKETALPAVKAQILALVTGGHSQYDLDTGQTRQEVRRLSLKELRDLEKYYKKEINRLENSIGSTVTIFEPVW